MANYLFVYLPAPARHFCNGVPIDTDKKSFDDKYVPCFFLYNDNGRVVILNFLTG